MDELKRKENESQLDYAKRITFGKRDKIYDIDYVEWAKLVLDKDLASDESRKRYYGYISALELLEQEKINNISDNSVLDEITMKKMELEKERIKLLDQRRELKKIIREDARWEYLKEEIIKNVNKINNKLPLISDKDIDDYYEFESDKQAILLLSDWHIGLEIHNFLNHYDLFEAKRRINILTYKTIEYCKLHNISKLHVELKGDLLSGLIHTSTRLSNNENIIEQIMQTSEMLAEMLHILSLEISEIDVYYTHGNHGRVIASKEESIERENFELLLPWYLETRLKDCKNIKIIKSKFDEIIYYNVLGFNIFGVHGQNDRLSTIIQDLTKLTKIIPDIITLGHWHKDYRDENGTVVIMNGSLCGVDEYALSRRCYSKPHQKLIIIEEGIGEICTYKISF